MRASPLQFALGLLGRLGGRLASLTLVRVFLHLGRGLVLFTQFGLDGLELLTQVVLALLLVHVFLDLVLDLLAQLQNFRAACSRSA